MRALNSIFKKLLIIALTVGLLSACGGKEERKAKYLEKGKAYLAEENYDKAGIEFKNVIQIDPKDAEGYYYAGLVQEKKQSWAGAFSNYEKAVTLDPDLIEARVRLARFYLAQASAQTVRENEETLAKVMGLLQEQLKEIKSRDPDNLEGLTIEATLWVNDGENDRAVEQLERVVSKDPGNQSAVILLYTLYERADRMDDAEKVLKTAIASSSEPAVLQKHLSRVYNRRGENEKAEALLRDIVKSDPDDLALHLDLASFLSRSGQIDKAEKVLRDAIAADPDDTQRYLLMADFLAKKRDTQAAIDELARVAREKPELTDLSFGLVKLYLSNEQQDEARQVLETVIDKQGTGPAGLQARVALAQLLVIASIEDERAPVLVAEVLKENPRDNGALLLKGKLAAYKRNYEEAIGDFRSVLKDQPDSEEVLLLLSSAHLANNENELAIDTLTRGVESNPDSIKLRLRLAGLLHRQGDNDSALRQLDLVLKSDSHNDMALRAKYELLAAKGDAQGVEEVARLMQEASPDKETGYIGEARLRFAQKEYGAAIDLLDKALEKNPQSNLALLAKMDVLAVQKKYDEAIALADRLLEISPGIAEAYLRKAIYLQAQDKLAESIEQYELALEKAPNSAEVLSSLVGVELKSGKKIEAEQRLLDILKENPQHAIANHLLGIIYFSNKDYSKAEKAFERQIAINPGLSSLYVQFSELRKAQGNIEGAVGTIQQGLDELPDDTNLMLTLAALREYQKDYDTAISIYEKVLELMPGNVIAVNNLAALLSDHRSDKASLKKAEELAILLERSDQAPLLDTAGWVFYRKGDYERAARILEKVVDSMPEVPVFQYHLGMVYFSLGDKGAASEHLTRATAGDASYTGIEEARATLKKL